LDSNESAQNQTFANRLRELMLQHNPPMQIIDLSDALQVTYEAARKMVRGRGVPSRFVILEIANFFGTDSADLEAVARADRLRRKYGAEFLLAILDPEVALFNGAWPHLTEEQKTELLARLLDYLI